MFTRLSSCWRNCHFRRHYSSAAETSQQTRRAPIANDLGGIQIVASGSRLSRQGRRSDSLDLKDFKKGTLSEQLAIRTLQNQKSQNVTKNHFVPSQARSNQKDNIRLSHQTDGTYMRQGQQRRKVDIGQNSQYPAQRRARSRPNKHEHETGAELELYEGERTDAIDDDVDATKTSFWLRCPDPPLAPQGLPLPSSLTMLEQKIYIDTPTHELLEQQGGDYVRYFSLEEWKIARAQSSAPLGVVDYARLAFHLNQTVPITQRHEGVEVVRKHVRKANLTALP